MKILFSLFFIIFLGYNNLSFAAAVKEFMLSTETLASIYNCTLQSDCDTNDSGKICTKVESKNVFLCAIPGIEYCGKNSDCKVLPRNTCYTEIGSITPFSNISTEKKVGICGASTGNADNNVMSDIVCKVIKIVNGKVMRTFAAAAVIFLGIMFFFGKTSWSMIYGVAVGAGMIFGAPALVQYALAGSGVMCPE